MPDINGNPLKVGDGVVVYLPNPEDPGHEFDAQHGIVIRFYPVALVEIQFDKRQLGRHLFNGRELMVDEKRKRKDDQ